MSKKKRKSWFARLFDMNDTSVSASTLFLVITSTIALILLLVPAVALLVEVFFNHTIATDLSGMAQYIAAVCGIFASGGILKGWTNYSSYRFNKQSQKEIVESVKNQLLEEELEEKDKEIYNEDEEELDA